MEAQITYGTTIHYDSTISKKEVWICDSEEEEPNGLRFLNIVRK